jgi:hypothetical protein
MVGIEARLFSRQKFSCRDILTTGAGVDGQTLNYPEIQGSCRSAEKSAFRLVAIKIRVFPAFSA